MNLAQCDGVVLLLGKNSWRFVGSIKGDEFKVCTFSDIATEHTYEDLKIYKNMSPVKLALSKGALHSLRCWGLSEKDASNIAAKEIN